MTKMGDPEALLLQKSRQQPIIVKSFTELHELGMGLVSHPDGQHEADALRLDVVINYRRERMTIGQAEEIVARLVSVLREEFGLGVDGKLCLEDWPRG